MLLYTCLWDISFHLINEETVGDRFACLKQNHIVYSIYTINDHKISYILKKWFVSLFVLPTIGISFEDTK